MAAAVPASSTESSLCLSLGAGSRRDRGADLLRVAGHGEVRADAIAQDDVRDRIVGSTAPPRSGRHRVCAGG